MLVDTTGAHQSRSVKEGKRFHSKRAKRMRQKPVLHRCALPGLLTQGQHVVNLAQKFFQIKLDDRIITQS